MRYLLVTLLTLAACSDPTAPVAPCADAMAVVRSQRGAPDSIMRGDWAIDSLAHRIPPGGPRTHYYEGWRYGPQVEAFAWDYASPICNHWTFAL